MTRRHEDHADVTEAETVAEVIAAGFCLFLIAFSLIAYVLVFAGMAVEAPR